MKHALNAQDFLSITRAYYAAIDAKDADRVARMFTATAVLQFNADVPIVSQDAIRGFSDQFFAAVTAIEHTRIEVWTSAILGSVMPMDIGEPTSAGSVSILSTTCPIFTVGTVKLPIPATSIFTIEESSGLFSSVHNMFDLAKVYAALGQ